MELAPPPAAARPDPALLEEIARCMTGQPASMAALWSEVKERSPAISLRADTGDWASFRIESLRSAARAGLLHGYLSRLLADGLVDAEPFKAAAARLLGEGCLGFETPPDDDEEDGGDLLLAETRTPSGLLMFEALPDGADGNQDFDGAEQRNRHAARQVCRIEIDGRHRGTGVLVKPLLVATAAHVVSELVDGSKPVSADFGEHHRLALPGSVGRLVLVFGDYLDFSLGNPFEGGGGERLGVPTPAASEWLAFYSPPATAERTRPFDVFCGEGIRRPTGPWDLALIRLAETPRSLGYLAPLESDRLPSRRSSVFMLHHPQHPRGTGLPLQISRGETLGSLPDDVRLLYSIRTAPGSSGAPCFDRFHHVVALHQGGAWRGEDRYGRAVPVEPWASHVDRIRIGEPVTYLATVPAVDGGAPQPVIGRRALQQRIWAAAQPDADAAARLFVIRGGPGRGKSFSARLLAAMRGKGHLVAVLDLANLQEADEAGLIRRIGGALGERPQAPLPTGHTTRERLALDGSLPELLALLGGDAAGGQPLWLVFDGFKTAGLLETAGVAQVIDGLVGALDGLPRLRLMLTGWTRPLPARFADCVEDLDLPSATPTKADIMDHALLRYAPPGMTVNPVMRLGLEQMIAALIQPVLDDASASGGRFYADLLDRVAPLLGVVETTVRSLGDGR